ncbi:PAS domain S-box protein [Methanocalculus sp.]|uniref:hybrid sensor histidine kinase/response regulator n=1 Tax=Methanocalculus sp. TaxID=2004547 RepID=UPI002717D3F5|nr:PAS domain S-box protein [Methanocalculus sp.]MDO8840994.1 PAS domain S-box protein [Methanocalculus sp.]
MSSAGSPVSLLLYVDDEPALLEIGKIYLEMGTEFVVDTACSAPEALALLESKSYDAIISDYQMPGMNGIELLKRVRSVGKQIPFIIFTGKGREEVIIEALNNGADFYLQKGGNPKALYTELVHFTRQSIQMRQMQLTFDEQQQRIHDLQNATDMIQSVGPDGHFFYVNKRWLEILGYQEEDIFAITLFDIIHEESLDHCMELFKRVMAGETVGTIEAIFRRSDGAKVYVEGIVNCKLVDGKPQYTRGLFKDITGRRVTEYELRNKNQELNKANEELIATHNDLRASEEKFRALVDNSLDGILIIDFSGKLLFVNKAAGTLVDVVDYHGVIGSGNVMEYIAPESQEDVLMDFRQVAAGNDSYPANYTLITALKREIWVESVVRRIRFGDSDAILISIRDITERKKAEDAIRQVNKKLNLLTGITRHDINNQLLILNGYVDLLESKLSDQLYERYFLGITKASDQITAMIGFTKEYEMIGVQAPVWLNQRDLITNAGEGAALGTIRLQNDLPEEIEVFADPLITKVFFNLIDNAIRHGGGLTRIRFSLKEGDDGVFIVCEDDGAGIPIEDKEIIFNRGYGRNTGYGLALSREILDITGITIKETGVFGRGARFEIQVPKGHLRSTPMTN